jgi:hypothetical protein
MLVLFVLGNINGKGIIGPPSSSSSSPVGTGNFLFLEHLEPQTLFE